MGDYRLGDLVFQIKGDSTNFTVSVNEAERKAKDLEEKGTSSFAKLRDAMQGPVAAARMIVDGLGKVIDVAGDLYNEFADAELQQIRLTKAVENNPLMNSESLANLNKFADSLQEAGKADADYIRGLEAQLVAQGKSEEQIKKLITVSLDYAAATGKDVGSVLETLNRTLEGSARGLDKENKAIADLTVEELKNGAALDVLNKQYGGFADTLTKSASGSVKQMKTAFGDLKETIGELVAEMAKPTIMQITNSLNATNSAIKNKDVFSRFAKSGVSGLKTQEEIDIVRGFYQAQKDIGPMNPLSGSKISGREAEKIIAGWDTILKQLDAYTMKTIETKEVKINPAGSFKDEVQSEIVLIQDLDEERNEAYENEKARQENLYYAMSYLSKSVFSEIGKQIEKSFDTRDAKRAYDEAELDIQKKLKDGVIDLGEAERLRAENSKTYAEQTTFSWKAVGTAAINSIGAIISAMGDELAASGAKTLVEAIAASFNPALAWSAPGLFIASGQYATGAAAAWTAGAALESVKLASGGMARRPTIAQIGDNPDYAEVVAPLSPEVFQGIANGIVNALAMRARPAGVTPATAGVSSYQSSISNGEVHLHVGTLVADSAGLRKLERALTPYRLQEAERTGA